MYARGLLAFTTALAVAGPAWAHIVPPEDFHPLAEAFRRCVFQLNLNPVNWADVERDTMVIMREVRVVSPEKAGAYEAAAETLLAVIEAEAQISVPTPSLRRSTAKALLELCTVAVAEAIDLHMRAAAEHLADYERAASAFDAARQISAAFEHEIQAADADGYRELGLAWLEAAGALGAPAVEGIGGSPADSETFGRATSVIRNYIKTNFGPGYTAPDSGPLVALPVKSPTCNPKATIPAKLPPGSNINKQLPRPRQVLNMAVRGVDETETTLIALGDMAFDSPYIFGEPARSLEISCNTCHNKSITNPGFFIPGLSSRAGGMDVSNSFFAPHANNGHFDPLDIPDLRGIRFTAPYGRNGRFGSLREFVRNVIVNEFNGPEPEPAVLDAMIAYMNEFDFLPNPYLTPTGGLTDDAPEAARRGEKLFKRPFAQMDNMSCATCHMPSNHFLDNKRHDIGSVTLSNDYARDGALDTPTLLSSLHTPPYFHDGSLATLRDVVSWFDKKYALNLSTRDVDDLTSYLECIGAGEEAYEDTMYTLEAELEEFSFFLSSYDFAYERGRSDLVGTICQTVASEIRAHKWDIQDPTYMPVLDQMASLMDEAYAASLAGDHARVESLVDEYRRAYDKHAEVLN